MSAVSIQPLFTVRYVVFAITGLVLAGFAALVLFGDERSVRWAAGSGVAGATLFATVVAIGVLAGRDGAAALWDEVSTADFNRSLQWAYTAAVLAIFPMLAASIVGGLAPLRAVVAATLLVGATQMILFSLFDRRGR